MKILNRMFVLLIILTLHITLYTLHSYAGIPHLINYQGCLTDTSGQPLNGSYNLTFRIYDAENAGNLLWQETHQGIVIQKGLFNILLGSVTNLDLAFDQSCFLEIKVGDEVMSPRQQLASAAYAFRAEHGVPRGVIVMWSGTIANIPPGWTLCDGSNGTPDLRDKFIVGARQDDGGVAKTNITTSLTQSGGSTTITLGNLPSHTHDSGQLTTNSIGEHNHSTNLYQSYQGSGRNPPATPSVYSGTNNMDYLFTSPSGSHSHTLSGSTGSTGSGIPYTQPYYALAYIRNSNT